MENLPTEKASSKNQRESFWVKSPKSGQQSFLSMRETAVENKLETVLRRPR
jgi:hypothetical protein